MDIRAMKHAVKLAEWSEKVKACRTSGMTVKEWCEQNHVCRKTYYAWEREYLTEVSKQVATPWEPPASTGQLVRIEPSQLRNKDEASASATQVQATANVGITIRYGKMSVEIPAGMGIRQVAELMKAVEELC